MRVLLLSQFFSTTRGGGEYVFYLLAKKLAENGHKVWVVTCRIRGEKYSGMDGVDVVFVEPSLEYKGGMPAGILENARYAVNAARVGRRLVKEHKIDVIHSNNFAPALAGYLLSRMGKPHVTTVHDVFSLCGKDYWERWGSQGGVSRMGAMLAPYLERLSVRLARHIHTVSEATRDDLARFGARNPVYVVHNAVEGERVGDVADIQQFVSVGRLVFYKNLEVVIRAVGIARQSRPGIRLVIVGDGPHRAELEKLVDSMGLYDNIRFAGHVSAQVKARLISGSAAMVFPSVCEGFGLVILESFLQDRPVLVSDVKPSSDIVEDGRTGYVIDPHDSASWAERMVDCVESPQDTLEMGRNGGMLLESEYSQDSMYQKMMDMYHKMVR